MNKSGVLIFSYTRRQAIADGVLVDVSTLAKEAGFRFPVAVTAAVWAECVTVPDGVAGQDETGRLWDVLNMLRFAITKQPKDSARDRFRGVCPKRQQRGRPAARSALCPLWARRRRRAGHNRHAAIGGLSPWKT